MWMRYTRAGCRRSRSIASRVSHHGSIVARAGRRRADTAPISRRPRISGPSDFRHVDAFTTSAPRQTTRFRPLELSIYLPQNQLSPLPVFTLPGEDAVDGDDDEPRSKTSSLDRALVTYP